MTDVIALAKERRARLAAEIAKLDEFIHMADMLVKYSPSKGGPPAGGDDQHRDRSGSAVVRSIPRP
jgi:hypothetical protein